VVSDVAADTATLLRPFLAIADVFYGFNVLSKAKYKTPLNVLAQTLRTPEFSKIVASAGGLSKYQGITAPTSVPQSSKKHCYCDFEDMSTSFFLCNVKKTDKCKTTCTTQAAADPDWKLFGPDSNELRVAFRGDKNSASVAWKLSNDPYGPNAVPIPPPKQPEEIEQVVALAGESVCLNVS